MTAKKRTDSTLGGARGSSARNTVSQMKSKETQVEKIANTRSTPSSIGPSKIKNATSGPS